MNEIKETLKENSKNETPTIQPQQAVGKCAYICECKQCERCSNCDYTVNGLRRFYYRNDKLICENCSWDQQATKKEAIKEQTLTKIKGTLTSQIRKRDEEKEPYYYAFVKLKGHGADLPVIFRIQDENNSLTNLKKGDLIELTGYYSNSERNIRKSFTCSEYQLLDKKIKKECSGCGDKFVCLTSENYDYCKDCELNGSRYLNKSNCAECDGSGMIKFPNQPVRNCKLCFLTKQKEGINSYE